MFGSELSKGIVTKKGRVFYSLWGYDHIGLRTRAMHVKNSLKSLAQPSRVLDAGSGNGCYSFYFAKKYPSARITGIDISDEKIQNLKIISNRLGLKNLVFHKDDLAQYRSKEKFDLINCIDVLEHIKDDRKALANLRIALKEDGILLLHVPLKRSLRRHYIRELDEEADHVRDGYTEEDIVDRLKKAHFSISQVRYTFGRYGSLARELSQTIEESGNLRVILKVILFPLLLSLAYLDTLTKNHQHQGLMLVCRQNSALSFCI